ncbi:trimeric intracellular cation channel family protein [Brevibacillus panacihumi]|uniref:Trimeric intracellular cation channel family protein n=1 Tax=Brevibacillus panacihumi TaxID=497735 RepID=A0A3M8DGE0_9BACL|nr:trimeric intracellular cation channel family protein [Brevibacillus panacihumi]RNB86395.1 trimeric intracellular cation channel family protein [Brevibacillus panacihumi]
MPWDWFNLIGTVAFVISGAIIAMEEEYDLLGVIVLGLATAFGGGILRNILLDIPLASFWNQGNLFTIALVTLLIVFVLPRKIIGYWNRWGLFFDAVGLSAFAIQGALYATKMNYPLSATIVAAVLTGIGGGIIRDVLAGRKPLVFQEEIYAVWAMVAGVAVGLNWTNSIPGLYTLFSAIIAFRMFSVYRGWKLPRRTLRTTAVPTVDKQM